jgi:hypothetical protein
MKDLNHNAGHATERDPCAAKALLTKGRSEPGSQVKLESRCHASPTNVPLLSCGRTNKT